MERRTVLCKLSNDELDVISSLNSLLSSYVSLMQNQFISMEEKESLDIDSLKTKVEAKYEELFNKYQIPLSMRSTVLLSYDSGEFYITTGI